MDTSEVHPSLFFTPMALFPDSCRWTNVTREGPRLCFTGGEGLFDRFWLLWEGEEEKEIFLWAARCFWSLINYPFLKFLVHLSLYVWVCVYVSICLSGNLPVHLHPCVWWGVDSHSSLPRGWVLLLLHPCNEDTGNFIRKYYRTPLKSGRPWSPRRFSWVLSVSGMSKWSLEIPRLINQAGHPYHVYDYTYSPMK